ncbi:MAG: glycosyl hydrolase 2 galactose-binding domain-containing protein [Candidatus Bathyarchaeia archaeon]
MPVEVLLNGLWQFKGFKECNGEEQKAYAIDTKVNDWLLAEAPLTAHTNLLANQLIPDPFRGTNEREVQWVNESEWWYRKEINLKNEIINRDVVELVFAGLDTYATVWVNNSKVGEASNMFTPWRFNIKKVAKEGKNVIAIRFKPIYKVASELEKQHKHKYTCLSSDNFSARPYVRKAQYSFGWDWGPTLPTSGIWREAKVVAYNKARLGYIAGLPIEVSKDKALIKITAEIHAVKEAQVKVKFGLAGFDQNIKQEKIVQVNAGRNFAECTMNVEEPQLWWPRGYGEPNMYDATIELWSGDELLEYDNVKVGIRKIELIEEPDEEGKTFIFRINNQNVFCKGANWVPADSFLPKVNYEQYFKLLTLAAEANFNMLRVWGGGVYEDDSFYSLCDQMGIMVWQDFMYVCAGYPEEEWFLREAEREAMEAVLRLRGHPSIVVWCGNNENQWLHNILWRTRDKVERLYGSEIYENLLLQVSKFLDPTRPYRPSSPFGGEDASGKHEGDRHNWEVWSQGIDYPAYLNDTGRFISEFGWQAPPTMALLRAYLEEADLTPYSQAFKAHEKQTGGLEILRALLAVHYPVPDDLRLFVLYSQLNQGDALKTAIMHWRSRMFKTSGCLIWQLNDCWPVISWSIIDYGINPKAAYYTVKRHFKPVIAPIIIREDKVACYVVNETGKQADFEFTFQVMRFNGKILHEIKKSLHPDAFTSQLVLEVGCDELPLLDDCFFTVILESGGKTVFMDTRTFREPKELKLPKPQIQTAIRKIDVGKFEVTLASNVYTKAVHLKCEAFKAAFEDNFFDLLPNQLKTVDCKVEADLSLEKFENTLEVEAYPYY